AIQGPGALARVQQVVCDAARAAVAAMPVFGCAQVGRWTLARTGYTGEDGVEIILPGDQCPDLWQRLLAVDVPPVGLGARDTLRLEAGLNLYGNEMDATVSPLEANLGWTLAWDPPERDFIGRAALEEQRRRGVGHKLVGLVTRERAVLRAHQVVRLPGLAATGEITSGTFSPTLGMSIAMARVPVAAASEAVVEIRGRDIPVQIVKPCFVRHGQGLPGLAG